MTVKKSLDVLAEAVAQRMRSLELSSQHWGLEFEAAGVGWARGSMVITEVMLNGHGTAHGGMIFCLADTVFAWACNSRNEKTVGQNASITYLSPGQLGEKLTAVAREEAHAGRSGVYHVTVTGEDGRKVAIFNGLSRTIRGAVLEGEE